MEWPTHLSVSPRRRYSLEMGRSKPADQPNSTQLAFLTFEQPLTDIAAIQRHETAQLEATRHSVSRGETHPLAVFLLGMR